MPTRILLASSNEGKLHEYRELAAGTSLELDPIPNFRNIPPFDESAPTFAENSAGKAMHYSLFVGGTILSDDSGLVVPALGGEPGVHSARYAGPNSTSGDRIEKLLREMGGKEGDDRRARFVCVTAIARRGRAIAIVSDFIEGLLTKEQRGAAGFGYDPVFFVTELGHTFGEASTEEKNQHSHRGRAFRKVVQFFQGSAQDPSYGIPGISR